jgi:hypothetical protein
MALQTTKASVVPANHEKPASSLMAEATLLSMLILTVYAGNQSKKALRRLRRKFLWTAFKLKLKSIFSPRRTREDRMLLYILIGVLFIILLILAPVAALILAIVGLILYLTGTI